MTSTNTHDSTPPSPRASADFPRKPAFQDVLRERVDRFFAERKLSSKGGARIGLKAVILFAWLIGSYLLLLFAANSVPMVLLLSASVALAVAGIGFNIQHDGGHRATSDRAGINRLAASAMDLLGVSSYIWDVKHNRVHHTFTNIDGLDTDLDSGPLLRLSPDQPRRPWHRFQHFYVWFLYIFFLPKWQFFDDSANLVTGRVGAQKLRRPRGADLAILIAGKLVFIGWTLALPLTLHAWHHVLGAFIFGGFVCGATIATVFQLAHCVREAEFHAVPPVGGQMSHAWAEHQFATTVNFARKSRFLTWYLGGLNFQVEHHVFPRVSHVHYPTIAPVVEQVCSEFGVEYRSHDTFGSALKSHLQHMRDLGRRAA